jgi:hypothetical protein
MPGLLRPSRQVGLAAGGNGFELLFNDFDIGGFWLPPELDTVDLSPFWAKCSAKFYHAASHTAGGEDLHPVADLERTGLL